MFTSIILVVYIGVDFLWRTIKSIHNKDRFSRIIQCNYMSILVIILWVISIWFEAYGERANSIIGESRISDTINTLVGWKDKVNNLTLFILIISVILCGVTYVTRKKHEEKDNNWAHMSISLFFCTVLVGLYLCVLTTRTGSHYLTRADVIFPISFIIILNGLVSISYLISSHKHILVISPIIIYLLVCSSINGTHVYKENICFNVSPTKARQVNNYIIDQVLCGVAEGKYKITIKVPLSKSTDDNFPHPTYMGKRIRTTLQRHGLIDHEVDVFIEPDYEVNKEFGLPY